MRDKDIAIVWQKIQDMIESCRTVRQLHNTARYYRLFCKQLKRVGDKQTLSNISLPFAMQFSLRYVQIKKK